MGDRSEGGREPEGSGVSGAAVARFAAAASAALFFSFEALSSAVSGRWFEAAVGAWVASLCVLWAAREACGSGAGRAARAVLGLGSSLAAVGSGALALVFARAALAGADRWFYWGFATLLFGGALMLARSAFGSFRGSSAR